MHERMSRDFLSPMKMSQIFSCTAVKHPVPTPPNPQPSPPTLTALKTRSTLRQPSVRLVQSFREGKCGSQRSPNGEIGVRMLSFLGGKSCAAFLGSPRFSDLTDQAPFIWRRVVPGRRLTRLPELPWASQLFIPSLTKLGEPFT